MSIRVYVGNKKNFFNGFAESNSKFGYYIFIVTLIVVARLFK